jgi:hypothetical protein
MKAKIVFAALTAFILSDSLAIGSTSQTSRPRSKVTFNRPANLTGGPPAQRGAAPVVATPPTTAKATVSPQLAQKLGAMRQWAKDSIDKVTGLQNYNKQSGIWAGPANADAVTPTEDQRILIDFREALNGITYGENCAKGLPKCNSDLNMFIKNLKSRTNPKDHRPFIPSDALNAAIAKLPPVS